MGVKGPASNCSQAARNAQGPIQCHHIPGVVFVKLCKFVVMFEGYAAFLSCSLRASRSRSMLR
jgi:hypothetical protein